MSVPHPPTRDGGVAAFAPVLVANLLPLVGVLQLGWDPATLVLVYGLEILLSLLLAGGKALFAQRPPPTDRDGVISVSEASLTAKRGRVRIHDALPPIYPRNVPFALSVVFGVALYGVVFGLVLSAVVADGWAPPGADVALAVAALAVGQLAETYRRYVRDREYERVSPYAVVEAPARQLFVLVFALVPLGPALGSTGALALVVCLKLLAEWSTFRADREESGGDRVVDRLAAWLTGPSAAAGAPDPVRAPETEPDARVRTARTAVILEGLLLGAWRLAFYVPFVGVLLFVAVLAVAAWTGSALVFWFGVTAVAVAALAAIAIQAVKHVLEYGALEYQRRGDFLVAYDRLLEEPQWAASAYRLRNVAVEHDRLVDRALGTRTVRVTTGIRSTETERRLGPVAEPDRLVEAFDLPVATTDLEPVNRPVAATAVALAAVIVLAGPALLVVPGAPAEAALNAVYLAPFLLLVPWGLWRVACPSAD